jgi:hypothetical protein
MSLWHRAPREVYRVYGEDQYLEGEIASREDATTVDLGTSVDASWAALDSDAPPLPPRAEGSSSAVPSGPHAGRMVGIGLLIGVGLATVVLVFLNASHRHKVAPESIGQGAGVEAEQRVDRAAGVGQASAIAHGQSARQAPAPRFSISPRVAPRGISERRLMRETPPAQASDPAPGLEQARATVARRPGNEAPAVRPPTQDEFSFEQ